MQSTITRKLNWHSSLLGGEELAALETALAGFYAGNPKYYANIDFTSDNWVNEEELGYQRIVKLVKDAQSICEIGCGSANILKYNSGIASRYTGLDFSPVQMQMNREIYPGASFIAFEQANVFPVQSSS
ncbi:MAG: hypothetical protein IPP31_09970 [Chitinophagaceae bacterium]|nr:hypothetical protein [Chitinophagaceae bacterium]